MSPSEAVSAPVKKGHPHSGQGIRVAFFQAISICPFSCYCRIYKAFGSFRGLFAPPAPRLDMVALHLPKLKTLSTNRSYPFDQDFTAPPSVFSSLRTLTPPPSGNYNEGAAGEAAPAPHVLRQVTRPAGPPRRHLPCTASRHSTRSPPWA